jgi:hypothetical protein
MTYRYPHYPKPKFKAHPKDCSVMTYRGHSVLRTLIRCHFSPAETTGAQYIYSGSADGKIHVNISFSRLHRNALPIYVMCYVIPRYGHLMGELFMSLTVPRQCLPNTLHQGQSLLTPISTNQSLVFVMLVGTHRSDKYYIRMSVMY